MVRESVADAELEKRTNSKDRAQRFALQVPLRYRAAGEDKWRRGETENISSSGVLFKGDYFVKSATQVEICLMMPVVNSEGAAEVVCRCVIVRAVRASDLDGSSTFAAKILHFRLVRP